MKAIKKPIPIEVVVFGEVEPPPFVNCRPKIGGGWEVWNQPGQAWVLVKEGDYLNVSDANDIYPIPKGVFEASYDIVKEKGQ